MNKVLRHKRCPHCGNLNTKKYGYKPRKKLNPDHHKILSPRWYCYDCNKTFSNNKTIFSITQAKRAAEHYFDGQSSYRNVAKVLHIDRMTAYDRIQEVCQRAKMPWELSLELKPTWSGYLALDSNDINVRTQKERLLLAADLITRDIPNAILSKYDDAASWCMLLTSLKDQLNYPIKGIVSDGDFAILSAVNKIFPDIRHQICVRHFENEMYRFLQYRKHRLRVDPKRTQIFMDYLHDVLYAQNIYDYRYAVYKLCNHPRLKHHELKDAIIKLHHTYKYLTVHFVDRNIHRTNNIVENIISQLDSKINQIIKFQSHETAWITLKLLISWYRFKKFSGCRKRNQQNNGKSPLELAGVILKNTHWIYQAIRHLEATNF